MAFSFSSQPLLQYIKSILGLLVPVRDNAKKQDVRSFNIEAAKAVADAVRTSLGPRGMDKMVSSFHF